MCLLLLAAALAACGGASHTGSYEHAVSKQEACCNGVTDPSAKQSCLDHIVRVDDPEVQKSDANLATYSCIERNFVCDSATGSATKESAQKQLDCVNDLQQ